MRSRQPYLFSLMQKVTKKVQVNIIASLVKGILPFDIAWVAIILCGTDSAN